MSLLPLSRTCALTDFPGCSSPADWQQRLLDDAYQRWWLAPEPDLHAEHVVLNASQGLFVPPPGTAQALRYFTTLGDLLHYTPPAEIASIVLLMVLDRAEAPIVFLKRAARDLIPGGLFLATVAYWDAEGADCAIGHTLRRRIYNRDSWRKLIVEAEHCGLLLYGGMDWTYHGHALGDHTLASLVLTKGATR